MRYLSLIALRLGLGDLFDKRLADLRSSNTGKTYEPALKAQLDHLEGLPSAEADPAKPITEQLGATDGDHDDIGTSVWHQTESYLVNPTVDPNLAAAAQRIRDNFIPKLAELRDAYAVEAERAMARKPLLATYKGDLELFPIAGDKTLYDWVSDYITAGERIHHLLSDRADASDNARADAPQKRSEIISLLSNFRKSLRDELKFNAALPADIEARIFGYFDELEQMRAATARAKNKPAASEPQDPQA